MKCVVLTILLLLVTACNRADHFVPQGGQDGGGGVGTSSTPEQVHDAIALAYRVATPADMHRNVFIRFWLTDYGNRPSKTTNLNPSPLWPKAALLNTGDRDYQADDFASPVFENLRTKPPLILEHGICRQGSRPHADAAVSDYTPNATVCFSVDQLRRYSPEDLPGQVISLLIHEAVHLGGERSETVAETWQNRFRQYYDGRFGVTQSAHFTDNFQNRLVMAADAGGNAHRSLAKLHDEPRAYAYLGAMRVLLLATPSLFDPLVLELNMKPQHPELYDNVINAILVLYDISGKAIHTSGKELEGQVLQVKDMLAVLNNNFQAYMKGGVDSTCILPPWEFVPGEVLVYADTSTTYIFHRRDRWSDGSEYDITRPTLKCSPTASL